MSVREVAAMLALSRSEAGRLRLRAIAEGLFEPQRQRDADLEEAALGPVCRPN
jgi:hypothetical protein